MSELLVPVMPSYRKARNVAPTYQGLERSLTIFVWDSKTYQGLEYSLTIFPQTYLGLESSLTNFVWLFPYLPGIRELPDDFQ